MSYPCCGLPGQLLQCFFSYEFPNSYAAAGNRTHILSVNQLIAPLYQLSYRAAASSRVVLVQDMFVLARLFLVGPSLILGSVSQLDLCFSSDALDALGLKRYCCRRMLLGELQILRILYVQTLRPLDQSYQVSQLSLITCYNSSLVILVFFYFTPFV